MIAMHYFMNSIYALFCICSTLQRQSLRHQFRTLRTVDDVSRGR